MTIHFWVKPAQLSMALSVATLTAVFPHVRAQDADQTTLVEQWNSPVQQGPHGRGWAEWLSTREQQTKFWIDNGRDDLSEPVGWMHNYVDPQGNSTLAWKPFSPQPSRTDVKNRAAWVAFNRSHNIRQVVEAARLYKVTSKKYYLNWVSEQLSRYAHAYNTLPLQTWGGNARLMTQTLDEAVVLIDFLEAYRLTATDLPDETKRLFYDSLVQPIIKNLISSPINGNISIWQASAIYIAAHIFDDKPDLKKHSLGPGGLLDKLKSGINKDGFWAESSLGYQAYVLRALRPALMIAATRNDRYSSAVFQHARRLMDSALSVRIAADTIPNPSDTIGLPAFVQREFHLEMFPALRTKEGLATAQARKTWATWAYPPGLLQANINSDISKGTRIFHDSKFALMKLNEWSVFFKYGDPSGQHSHNDKLGIELFFNGTGIMVDPGTVAYGDPMHEGYFKKSIAHNVITINDQEANAWRKEVKVSVSAEGNKMVGEDTGFMEGEGIRRSIFLGDQFVMTTVVKTKPREAVVRAIQSFECNGIRAISPTRPAQPDEPIQKIPYLKASQSWLPSQQHQFTMMCEGSAFSLKFASDAPTSLAMFEAPKNPYSGKARFTFVQTTRGETATFHLQISTSTLN